MKKLHDTDSDVDSAVRNAIEALYDAADDDSATGGPDPVRRIYPTVITITGADGAVKLPEERTAAITEQVTTDRVARAERR
jgi:proteasome beta subunit